MRVSDSVRRRSLWNVVVASAALGLCAASAAADTTVHLIAAPLTKTVTLPSGSTISVPMWGYAEDKEHTSGPPEAPIVEPPNGVLDADEPVTVPGPRIVVPVGSTTLQVTLTNLLPEATSLFIPGQPFAATPARTDGRVRSMTVETAPGATQTYTFAGLKPGTFLYQSASHPAVQVQMGLYGALTQDTSAGSAYAGVEYAHEAVLVYSEIDLALHEAVANGSYGAAGGRTSTLVYRPSLFLINGESYTNESAASIAAGTAGEVTLLRIVNAGLRTHAPVLDNGNLTIVAEDGNKLPFAKDQAAVMLPAGKTHDALWIPGASGVFSLYDRMLSLNAPGQGTAGMLAKLRIGAADTGSDPLDPAAPPVAHPDSASGPEDSPAIAGSVLGNDVNAETAELVASPHAGLITLLDNGTFSYIPNHDFFGVDEFTYRAVRGGPAGLKSAPALVSITVTAVPDPPVADAQAIGVDFNGNVNVTLSATDADGDVLSYYLKTPPTSGALTYIDPLTKVETPLGADEARSGPGEKAVPGGHLIYRPATDYSGPAPFTFVAFDGTSDSAPAAVDVSVHPADEDAPASDLTAAITLIVKGNDGSAIASYRWTLEEDLTYKVVPGAADPHTLAVRFHTSYTPVVAAGTETDTVKVNPAKRYFISVLPTENSYSNTGAQIAAGQTAVTVTSSKLPLPTARIRVQVFEDNAPLDAMLSGTEAGLQGFQVTIDDAGGTYGMSGGHQSTDAFGNKIGTTYQECKDADGNPAPGTCDSYQVAQLGDGFVLTDAAGFAVIPNLPMGKYTVKVRAPGGDKWIQTTTIEGTPGIDAWVKPNEPQFFTEFGPPGPHVLVGFVKAAPGIPAGPFRGTGSITGRVTNLRMSRPPETTQSSGAPFTHTRPWVALNSAATGGSLLYTQPVNEDGTFTISNVAVGNYSLVVFDSQVDLIIASRAVDVVASGPTALGDVPAFSWFSNLYSYVYDDLNRNGHRDDGEPGIADQALNIRFRDGSIYQSLSTDDRGFKAFNEVFPFFAWMVAEVDYTRFHSTGVTVVVDGGGVASASNNWQAQAGLPAGLVAPNILNPQPQAENGGLPYRDESGAETPFLLLEGFQGFLGQSAVMLWGKAPYEEPGSYVEDFNAVPFDDFPGPSDVDSNSDGFFNADRSNGGIAGIVHYTITRAENDPRWAVAENWEPGVSDVRIQLWDENRTHLLNEAATDNFNNLQPEGCQGAVFTFRGQPTDCYDGLRNFNQARPAVFDGGYAFSSIFVDSADPSAPRTFDKPLSERLGMAPIPAGKYVVKMIVPPGYKVQKEEDKNVDFGDQYMPQQFWLTGYDLADAAPTPIAALGADVSPTQTTIALGAGEGRNVHPNDVINVESEVLRVTATLGDSVTVIRAWSNSAAAAHASGTPVYSHDASPAPTVEDNTLIAQFCVGALHTVPDELSLFPGLPGAFGGEKRPLCDAKLVNLRDGQQAAPDFHLLTDAPKAGHIYGMVLDDTTNEFDPNAPTFGEKYAPPFMPVAIRDWQGREVVRTYTDEYGMYNALVPSTYTIQVPQPSGVAPSILQACINAPTMPDPANPDRVIADPLFQRQYSHFCYPLQYLPGKTTYLDTPVLPTGAFTGTGAFPVDADLPNRTPVVASVTGSEVAGPYIVDRGPGGPAPAIPVAVATAARTIVIKSAGKVQVPNPAYGGPGSSAPKLITRDYGFGTPSSLNGAGFVTLGGQKIPYTAWSDAQITAVVPTLPTPLTQAGLASSRTGQLAVERCLDGKTGATSTVTGSCNDGRKSVLGVILNVATPSMHASRPPTIVAAGQSIQAAIDAATAGDLLLVQPGTYEEMVVMSKPVRLQGAGAFSTIINVVTTPSDNVQAWLDYTGQKLLDNPEYLLPAQPAMTPAPFQAGDVMAVISGEGAGVTVLGKNQLTALGICLGGFDAPFNEAYCLHNENFGGTALAAWLRPNARIDGFSIIGANNAPGVLANGYNRYLEISNNKLYTNSGNYAGGIQLGHAGQLDLANENAHLHFASIHNNLVTQNAGQDPSGGGGIVLGTGSGTYRVFENFIAGNFAAGQGAGIAHIGDMDTPLALGLEVAFVLPTYWGATPDVPSSNRNVSVIDRNTIVFNESFSQGIGTNGGGIFIGSTPPAVVGGAVAGTGQVRVSNNLIQGNAASGGDGGGVALMNLNGSSVGLYNNVIANNVAGFAGGGIALQDAGSPEIAHNTIVNNDSLSTAGLAFNVPGNPNQSAPMPAGIFVRNTGTGNVPKIVNSIVWHNRSFYFGLTAGGLQIPGTTATRGLIACTTSPCSATGFWDSGRSGSTTALAMVGSTTSTAGTTPTFVKEYVNTDRRNSYQQTEVTTILVPAALDEGGNFIRPLFGPLSLTKLDDTRFSNYHTSTGVNGISLASAAAYGGILAVPNALLFDLDAQARPPLLAAHTGADQVVGFVAPPVAVNDTASTPAGAAVTIPVLTNDNLATPASGKPLVVTGVSLVVGGTATTNGTSVTYTPDPGFEGQGSFAYAISGVGGEASASVIVNVGAATPVLALSPAALNFPNATPGTTSAAKVVTVANTGNLSMTISSIDLGGADAAEYSRTTTCAATLAANATCTVSVTFHPASIGTKLATLDVNVGGPGVSGHVPLAGTGLGTGFSAGPASLAYGDQTLNQASSTLAVTVTNTGNVLAEFGAALSGLDAAQFTVTHGCPAMPTGTNRYVAPGGVCAVNVSFRPTSLGAKSATLTVSPTVGSPTPVALSGSGVAVSVARTPDTLSFGSVAIGTPSPSQAVTITNSGAAPVQLALSLTGTSAAQFTQTGTCPVAPAALASLASCVSNVVLTPAGAVGARSAGLVVTPIGNAALPAVTLTGNATFPPPVVAAPAGGATVSGNVALTATLATTSGVNRVQFLVGATIVATDTSPGNGINGSWTTLAANNGPAIITARACGNATCSTVLGISSPVSVTVSNIVTVTAPANGATVSGSVSLAATSTGGVMRVQFLRGATIIATDTSPGNGVTGTWNTLGGANGLAVITARSCSNGGAGACNVVATSAAVTVTVGN